MLFSRMLPPLIEVFVCGLTTLNKRRSPWKRTAMVVRGEDRREAGGPSRSGEGSPSIPQQDGPAKEHRRGVTTTFEVPIELAGTAVLDSRGHLLDAECRVLQQPLGSG